METWVEVKLTFEATHRWPDAIPQVGFLEYPHRHRFEVTARVRVTDPNRQVEFFILASRIRQAWRWSFGEPDPNGMTLLGDLSCEMMAQALIASADLDYCAVYEDGENGAIVTR